MKTRLDLQTYQRAYYLFCVTVDREGMRRQWREAKKRQKARRLDAAIEALRLIESKQHDSVAATLRSSKLLSVREIVEQTLAQAEGG